MEFFKEGMPEPTPEYLKPTEFLDFDTPSAVRDSIRYDPYQVELEPHIYRASHVLVRKAGFCLPKANLLAASARAVGIHAGIGLSDVVNHLCTERLRRLMGEKNLFSNHGYAVLHLDGKWFKAAPAFNIELCERFHVLPTEFDGKSDALFQQYDREGRRHMDYVRDHGIWSDFPFDKVVKSFRDFYPESFYDPQVRETVLQRFEEEQPLG
jgi:hypothetical protein